MLLLLNLNNYGLGLVPIIIIIDNSIVKEKEIYTLIFVENTNRCFNILIVTLTRHFEKFPHINFSWINCTFYLLIM